MSFIKLKRGYDLNLSGKAPSGAIMPVRSSELYAIVPDDFVGVVPRLEKKAGERVVAGEALYHDKAHESIVVTSPVSGTVKEVVRGERRKILAIVVESDGRDERKTFNTRESVRELLLESGLWAMMRQRPYDVVPNPDKRPRDIFVTSFDSAPLAPSLTEVMGSDAEHVARGVEALATLTDGKVHLGCRPDEVLDNTGAEVHVFQGPHPAGNAGVQAANVKPVNKGEVVWTLDVVTVARLGKLLATGTMDYRTVVAVTGAGVKEPRLVEATMGCPLAALLDGELEGDTENLRIINGNVLTGSHDTVEGWLRAPYRHITVIPEVAKRDEFMGWASLSLKKFSVHRNFLGTLFGCSRKERTLDAKLNGGERAIVMAGEYDRMVPMDIHCEFLIKAIIAFDIDKMEQLGIYEVAPEDFALAEMACTSKLELQKIVREGLDKMRAEME